MKYLRCTVLRNKNNSWESNNFSLQSSFIIDAKPPSMRVLYQLRLEQTACIMILYSVCDAYLLEVCFVNSIKRMKYNEVSYFMLAYSNS